MATLVLKLLYNGGRDRPIYLSNLLQISHIAKHGRIDLIFGSGRQILRDGRGRFRVGHLEAIE